MRFIVAVAPIVCSGFLIAEAAAQELHNDNGIVKLVYAQPIVSVFFDKDARLAVVTKSKIDIWNLKQQKVAKSIDSSRAIDQIQYNAQDHCVIVCTKDPCAPAVLEVIALESTKTIISQEMQKDEVFPQSLILSSDGAYVGIVIASEEITSYFCLYNYKTLKQIGKRTDNIVAAAFTPDGKNLVEMDILRALTLYSDRDFKKVTDIKLDLPLEAEAHIRFSRDGRLVSYQTGDCDLRSFDFKANKEQYVIKDVKRKIVTYEYLSEEVLAVGFQDGGLSFFNAKDGKLFDKWSQTDKGIVRIVKSLDCVRFAVVMKDNSVTLHELKDIKRGK